MRGRSREDPGEIGKRIADERRRSRAAFVGEIRIGRCALGRPLGVANDEDPVRVMRHGFPPAGRDEACPLFGNRPFAGMLPKLAVVRK